MKYLYIFIFLPAAFIPWLAPPRGQITVNNFPLVHFLGTPQQAWVTCSCLSQLLLPGWDGLSSGHTLHPRAQWSWLSLKSLGYKWVVRILKKKKKTRAVRWQEEAGMLRMQWQGLLHPDLTATLNILEKKSATDMKHTFQMEWMNASTFLPLTLSFWKIITFGLPSTFPQTWYSFIYTKYLSLLLTTDILIFLIAQKSPALEESPNFFYLCMLTIHFGSRT